MEAKKKKKLQLSFGWDMESHQDRDQIIADVCLPKSMDVDDGSVSKSTLMLFFYRLNHHAWGDRECFPGVKTLAKEMGVDRKTVTRSIEAATRLGLLSVEKKKTPESKVVCNHYALHWEEILRRGQPAIHPENRSVEGAERGDTLTPRPSERGDMSSGAWGHTDSSVGTLCPQRGDTLTPDYGVVGTDSKRPSPTARAVPTDQGGDGVLDFRWGRRVDPAELYDPAAIERLYEHAILQRAVRRSEADRLVFFALVAHVARSNSDREQRIGLLTALLAGRVPDLRTGSRDWRTRPQNCDEDQAALWLARLDRDIEDDDPQDAVVVETTEQSRARQIAALKGAR